MGNEGSGSAGTGAIYTHREEDKYVINKKYYNQVLDEVESRMKPYYPKKGTEYTITKTQYLDDDKLGFVKAHLRGDENRYKLRVRTYGPDGEFDKQAYLEVKYKIGDVKKKDRILISDSALLSVMGGKSLPADVRKDNLHMTKEEYTDCENLINQFSQKGLSPVTQAQYKRMSFKSSDCRVTIDTGLVTTSFATLKKFAATETLEDQHKLSEYSGKFNASDDFILEVKYDIEDEMPKWISDLLDDVKADPGFSKYMFSVGQVLT